MTRGRNRAGPQEVDSSQLAVEEYERENARDLAKRLRSFAAKLAGSQFILHAQQMLPKVLEQAELLDIERVTIADACQMSAATVSRWTAGQVTPHVIVARAAIEAIRAIALQEARICEQRSRRVSRVIENA
jgi:hypothetical protein